MPLNFALSRLPRILFRTGGLRGLVKIVRQYGQHALILTGGHSLRSSPYWEALGAEFDENGIHWQIMSVTGEPSPQFVDDAVQKYRGKGL
jgi:alcohol dehydrogenase class IV